MKDSLTLENLKGILSSILEFPMIKGFFTTTALAYDWIFADSTTHVYVVAALLALDTITGVWKSYRKGTLWSRGFFRVAAKTFVYLILLATGSLVDKILPVQFAFTMMAAFLGITEALSIMENISQLGWPVPSKLVEKLKVMKENDPEEKLEK